MNRLKFNIFSSKAICSAAAFEVYTECDAKCQGTCDNPKPTFCPAVCASGCKCQDGYLKNSEGKCVHPSDCPRK